MNEKLKGIYIVGGYPDCETFSQSLNMIPESEFNFVEVGIPFNDPVADGPVISGAANSVISKGTTTEDIIKEIISFKAAPVKKFVMTYANIINAYGYKKFSEKLSGALNGVIIPDLPNRMTDFFYSQGFDIPIVPFATLETREADLEMINAARGDMVYFVGIRGITGSAADFYSEELTKKISMIKRGTDKRVILGFGIKTAKDAARAIDMADGFVIGTEAVRRQDDAPAFRRYISEFESLGVS